MAGANDQRRGVRLRALGLDDCDRLLSWIDPEDALYQWSGAWSFSWPLDRQQLVRNLDWQSDSRSLFAAVDRGDGELVGTAKLEIQPTHGLGLIGHVLVAPHSRGRGYGTALMHALVRHSFDERGLHRLQLSVYTFNSAAIACYQRVGFLVEGRLRECTRFSDGFRSSLVMGLLAPDDRGLGGPAAGGQAIRAARLDDCPEIAELLTQLGYPHDAAGASERLLDWAGAVDGAVLVAEIDGAVAGFIAVHAVPYFERRGAFARIVALSVDQDHRRGGLGRQLVGAAEKWAAARGCVDVEVTSRRARHDAHDFYAALGYEDECRRSGRFKRALGSPA